MTADDEVAAAAIRIAIAEDHAAMRSGLQMLLDAEQGLEVVAASGDLDGARRAVRDHHPDVLILALDMLGGASLEAIGTIRTASPDTRIIVLTMSEDSTFARQALRAGASGCVLREAADSELVEAVRRSCVSPRAPSSSATRCGAA